MLESLFEELIAYQKKKVLTCAQKIVPHVTPDDLMQPNDFTELERHPLFRYEEGILEGIQTAKMAYLAWKKDQA